MLSVMKIVHNRRERVARIAICLPADLFRSVERVRKEAGLGRSTLVQRALEEFMARRERAALLERYVEGYRRAPEDIHEVEAAASAAAELLSREPWE